MIKIFAILFGGLSFAATAFAVSAGEEEMAALEKRFRELPMDARRLTGPLFWLHGDESRERLEMYLDKVVEGGNGCFTAESRPHNDWLGEGWFRDLAICLEGAKKRDLMMWIFDERWWPSQGVGGKVPPRWAAKRLAAEAVDVDGPRQFKVEGYGVGQVDNLSHNQDGGQVGNLSHNQDGGQVGNLPHNQDGGQVGNLSHNQDGKQVGNLSHKGYIAAVAGRVTPDGKLDGGSLVDIAPSIKDGTLDWAVPAGKWRIMKFTHEQAPPLSQNKQLSVDGASRDCVEWYIETVYQPHYDRFKDDFGKTIAGFFYDEPETLGDWGTELGAALKRRGVDWKKAYAAYKFELAEDQAAAKYAYLEAFADAWGDTLYGGLQRWCRARGVQSIGHFMEHGNLYRHPEYCAGDMMRLQRYSDMGGIDAVYKQFVMGRREVSKNPPIWQTPKLASSISHVFGKADDLAMVEIFGARGQDLTYREMKWWTDHMQVSGVNFMIPHSFNPRAPYDKDCPPYFYNGGFEPRWPLYRVWADYTSRISLLMSGGRHVCPAAILFSSNLGQVGKMVGPEEITTALQNARIDCDWLPVDVFERDAALDGNQIKLHNESYGLLIVPPVEAIPYETLAKVKQFVDNGGTVIGYGFLPSKSATIGKTDADIAALCREIWGELSADRRENPNIAPWIDVLQTEPDGGCAIFFPQLEAKNMTFFGSIEWIRRTVRPKLRVLGDYQDGWLHVLHRNKAGRDIFLICNQHDQGPGRRFLMLATARGEPELWDPMRNEITAVPFERIDDQRVMLSLALHPLESVLLVFQPEKIERPMRIEPETKPIREQVALVREPNSPLKKTASGDMGATAGLSSSEIAAISPRTAGLASSGTLFQQAANPSVEPPTPDMTRKPLTLGPVKAADPFRGRATIPAGVDLQKCRVFLEMEDLPDEAAAVTVNGARAGGLIGPPLRLDITRHVKPGENYVIIEPLAPKSARLAFHDSVAVAKEQTEDKTEDKLSSQFRRPPDAARPWVYWFWLDGNLTREGITADLEAMQRVGVGGVLIMEVDQNIPKGPVRFGSPEWRKLFQHVVAEAERLGLEVSMNNDAGWCGSGGPWVTPEHAMQKLVWTETDVEGPRRFEGVLPRPEAVADFYRDAAVLAFPTPPGGKDPNMLARIARIDAKNMNYRRNRAPRDNNLSPQASYPVVSAEVVVPRNRVVDLSARLDKDGRATWDVPAGRWTLMRFGYTPTGKDNHPAPVEGRGLECDKLSKEAVGEHFAGLMGKLIEDVGSAAGRTLTSTHIDSWEVHSQNWTPLFREEFQRRRGYDLLTMLPAMTGRIIDNLEVSERFLWDVRKTIGEMVLDNYADHIRELAARHGMKLSIEAYDDGPFDDLSYAGRADVPMGEFWMKSDYYFNTRMQTCRAMASAAHTYGKPICGAEAFTAFTEQARWINHPFSLKALGDEAFCEGVNRFVFHRYAHQPWLDRKPGMTMGKWGIHYERTQTWWELSRPWHEYLARCNFMLRQGLYVADICYLQTEGVPNGATHVARTAYEFDACSPEVVLTRMSVRDGRLVLPDGMSYRILVLPPCEKMTPELLDKIKELVAAGATVVGPRPNGSPSLVDYPRCDEKVRQLAAELWGEENGKPEGEHVFGLGKVIWGKTPDAVLAEQGVTPDFQCEAKDGVAEVRYIHRTVNGDEVYFIACAAEKPIAASCTFRVAGKRPEFWRPDTGRIERVADFERFEGRTRIPIRFDPCGSVFVVFRPENSPAPTHDAEPVELKKVAELTGPWTLHFPAGSGAPERVVADKLQSWSECPEAGVKYFSGTAVYEKSFQLPEDAIGAGRRVYLDLGRVAVIAEVKLNGKELGILWKPPFRVDATGVLKPGENTLQVKVTNLWPNRLIGDEQLPPDSERKSTGRLPEWPQWLLDGRPSPTGRRAFTTWNHWRKDSPLLESGLLGPVRILLAP